LLRQRTIMTPVRSAGVGLHSGQRVELMLKPAPADSGIVFVRTDLGPVPAIRAGAERVGATMMATSLSTQSADGAEVRISTVEHIMSAFAGLGIDNVIVEVNASEIPILDGSSGSFVYLIQTAGIVEQNAPKRFVRVLKSVVIEDGISDSS
jgi:UDP-3-O-[3-hydroxymyristoyl] N-acetylglucosamine deacetylase